MNILINAKQLRASLPKIVERVRKGAQFTVLYRSRPAFRIVPVNGVPASEASLVRPYTLTAGRTKASVEFPLEAPVQTLQSAMFHRWPLNDVRGRIVQLCVKSPSVAEISARLNLPLGVTRVLVGDLARPG